MGRYDKQHKERAVARLLPPESAAISRLSRELGVSVRTLARWRADALSPRAHERVWTADARWQALVATADLDETQRSAWCREQGICPADLKTWQETATAALSQPDLGRAVDRRRIEELERELKFKDRELAKTAALLVLVEAIFRQGEES
jgi:transposase-like protein